MKQFDERKSNNQLTQKFKFTYDIIDEVKNKISNSYYGKILPNFMLAKNSE